MPSLEELLERARVLADDRAARKAQLSAMAPAPFPDLTLTNLLKESPKSPDDVPLGEFIRRFRLDDWVRRGMEHIDGSGGELGEECPFCQQPLPLELLVELRQYFEHGYEEFVDRVSSTLVRLEDWVAELARFSDRIIHAADAEVGKDRATLVRSQCIAAMEASRNVVEALRKKVDSPSLEIEASSLENHIQPLVEAVALVNERIAEYNSIISQRVSQQAALRSDVWRYLAKHVEAEVAVLKGAESNLQKIRQNETKARAGQGKTLKKREEELASIRLRLVSSARTSQRINNLLKDVGFTNFSLAQDPSGEDYTLRRQDGSAVGQTLSEGEATFVALLYFLQALEAECVERGSRQRPVVAVIDDPVSSLDSSISHHAAVLIKRLTKFAAEAKNALAQLLILTHSTYFYRQVAAYVPKELKEKTSYGVLRRRGDLRQYVPYDSFPVRSSYALLWDEVPTPGEMSSTLSSSAQNSMRRIVETYFSSFGGARSIAEIAANFSGEDAIACESLVSWLHVGSHSIFDDLEYSPDVETSETFLKVFERLFIETGNAGHYRTMMEGRRGGVGAT